jgi:hypothetical protein
MQSPIHKLIILTNRFIEADDRNNAREIRDRLVNDVFPDLTKGEKKEFSDFTEFVDMARTVRQKFGKIVSEDEVKLIAEQLIKSLRLAEERHKKRPLKPSETRSPKLPE